MKICVNCILGGAPSGRNTGQLQATVGEEVVNTLHV